MTTTKLAMLGKAVVSRVLAQEPEPAAIYTGPRGLGLKKLRAHYSPRQVLLKACGNCGHRRYNPCGCERK